MFQVVRPTYSVVGKHGPRPGYGEMAGFTSRRQEEQARNGESPLKPQRLVWEVCICIALIG